MLEMNHGERSTGVPAHAYRHRILRRMAHAIERVGPIGRVLDFGSGDGYFAKHLPELIRVSSMAAVDVAERQQAWVRPTLYSGDRLPFPDRSFDLVYAVDVLHHCPDPFVALAEMCRCTRQYLLIKDHNCSGSLGKLVLSIMDEMGNRRFGIPSPYRFQHDWGWIRWLSERGYERLDWEHPMGCHAGILAPTNRLQFLGLWQRPDD
jgi:SAM-dependent methyltransferase